MNNPYLAIKKLLQESNISFEEISHEPVFTSVEAAKIRGLSLSQGAKSLLLKTGGTFILAVLPGDRKLDTKKLKKLLQVKDIRFATPDEVVNVMGCEIGACYPIGTIINMQPFVDKTLSENTVISFNPGVHDKSIKMTWVDYEKLVSPQLVDIIL